MKYFKWLANSGPIYGTGTYDLSGAWQQVEGPLSVCFNGYHVCTAKQLPLWAGTELWEVEIQGDRIGDEDKICAREIRFVRKLNWDREKMIRLAWCCAFEAASDAADGVAIARHARYAASIASHARNAAAAIARNARNAAACANDRHAAAAAGYAAAAADNARVMSWIEAGCGESLAGPEPGGGG
jgi:hypothetical protein